MKESLQQTNKALNEMLFLYLCKAEQIQPHQTAEQATVGCKRASVCAPRSISKDQQIISNQVRRADQSGGPGNDTGP